MPKATLNLLKLLRAYPGFCCRLREATGGYEQPVVQALQAADIPVSIIEAGRVRYFARAQGQRSKNLIRLMCRCCSSEYGVAFQPSSTPPAATSPNSSN